MSTKKPSLQTQLKAAKEEAKEHKMHAEKLQKDLDNEKQTKQYMNGRAERAEQEIAQIHAFLDAVPNPPADKMADGYTKIGAMTRLSVFLATRNQGASQ